MHREALRVLVEKAPEGSNFPVQREILLALLQADDFNANAPTSEQLISAIEWYHHFRDKPDVTQSAHSVAECWLRAWVKVRLGERAPSKEP